MKLQEKIKKALEKFCAMEQSYGIDVKVEDFCLDENPFMKDGYLGWGWGKESGYPSQKQNYSWVTYEAISGLIQVSYKRGNIENRYDLDLEGNVSTECGSVIPWLCWEDETNRINIEQQLEKAYLCLLDQLILGRDILISFQNSKNLLSLKKIQAEGIAIF